MDNSNPTETEIDITIEAIAALKERVAFGKVFQKLYNSDEFQEVIMETMLGKEVDAKAKTLALNPYMDKELEEETLTVLRSMRYLNQFIQDKLLEAKQAPMELAMNEDYLAQLVLANKE